MEKTYIVCASGVKLVKELYMVNAFSEDEAKARGAIRADTDYGSGVVELEVLHSK